MQIPIFIFRKFQLPKKTNVTTLAGLSIMNAMDSPITGSKKCCTFRKKYWFLAFALLVFSAGAVFFILTESHSLSDDEGTFTIREGNIDFEEAMERVVKSAMREANKGRYIAVLKIRDQEMKWFHKTAWLVHYFLLALIDNHWSKSTAIVDKMRADWFLKFAQKGNVAAQEATMFCYMYGIGVEKDLIESKKWRDKVNDFYRKIAEKGDVDAQFRLGGWEEDLAERRKWLRKAAEQGHIPAYLPLAGLSAQAEDFSEAFKWWSKEAERGNHHAYLGIAMCYEEGKGVEKNEAEAIKWLRKAAEKDNWRAQKRLEQLGISEETK